MGNVFGEMSFFCPGPRSATTVADEKSILYKLVPAKFQEMESHAPTTAIKLLKVFIAKIVTRLRQTDEALMQPRGQKIIIT
jgi:CRP-like cAMP-binding protein